jgi:hypothetical protein
MAEHTMTELDTLYDWKIVSLMAEEYGYFPAHEMGPAETHHSEEERGTTAVFGMPLWCYFVAGLAVGVLCVSMARK